MRFKIWSLGFFLVLLVSGCSTLSPITDEKAIGHIISIGRDGNLEKIEPQKEIVLNPRNATQAVSSGDFGYIFDGIRNFPKNDNDEIEVLIFIHGGLNTKKSAIARVQKKYALVKNANKYPIFVNWRSGPATTYKAHLVRIRQGEVSSTAPFSSPIYCLTDFANSIVNTPKSWFIASNHSINSTFFRKDSYLDLYKNGDNGVYFAGNSEKNSTLGRSIWWLLSSPVKVVTTPFTYTLPKPAWDIMLRRTETLFYRPSDFKNKNHDVVTDSQVGTGALLRFLIELESVIKNEQLPVKISLVGHSMGAIVVNKIINLGIDLPYKNIVHLASADSIKNLFGQVIPYISTHTSKFYSLSLHPKNEDREVSAFGATPSGSLLVWIDNMFTTPETLMDKRSGRWENMEKIIHLIPKNAKEKMHFKIYGLNDSGTAPQAHGDFGNIPYWLESTWWK